MYHYSHPEICPKTHQVYHETLYFYILKQIHNLARSMKRRNINSLIKEYATIDELTMPVISNIIERIEVGHVTRKSKPKDTIHIQWKMK